MGCAGAIKIKNAVTKMKHKDCGKSITCGNCPFNEWVKCHEQERKEHLRNVYSSASFPANPVPKKLYDLVVGR
jgi:hypothetical protein